MQFGCRIKYRPINDIVSFKSRLSRSDFYQRQMSKPRKQSLNFDKRKFLCGEGRWYVLIPNNARSVLYNIESEYIVCFSFHSVF